MAERIAPSFLVPLLFDPVIESAATAAEQAERADQADGAPQSEAGAEVGSKAGSKAASHDSAAPSFKDLAVVRLAAAQMGLALENDKLLAQVAAEIAAREKRQRELEIARDVQQRLFPQDHPPVAGLDYAGACRPAFEVGGDYYDFITISPQEFGIAIGDVSGKGIPASLLMATLRAYLRGQTAARSSELPTLMTNLNRFVFDSSPANRYATFFYAQYDTATRVLTYVNGGHNPPCLFRAAREADADADPIRLESGGPVIGLLPWWGGDSEYVQGQTVLGPGDLLVAFTDGVSEANDAAEAEWGEQRLIDTIRDHRDAPADELLARIMAAVDAFVGGAPQYDDMTLVVIRGVQA